MLNVTIGFGKFTYRLDPGWGHLPDGWDLDDVPGIVIDRQDRVYAFTRSEHAMVVFDREGTFLGSWGEGMFKRPHGVHIGPDDTIYCTDDVDQTVRKFTLDGRLLMTIGTSGQPAPEFSGRPFNRPTHTALSPRGDIYVADGYANARVHRFSPDGKLLTSWGESGTEPGQFNVVHNICCDAAGFVYVADRDNLRIQVFDDDGRFVAQWNTLTRPCGLYMHGDSSFFVAELGPVVVRERPNANIPPRVTILDNKGNLLAHLGTAKASPEEGAFIAPHTVAVDSRGDLYVGEVSYTVWPEVFFEQPKPAHIHSLQKFIKIG